MDSSKDSNVSVLAWKSHTSNLEYDKTWLILEVDFRAHCQLSVITYHECAGI